jgi:hypothetical protein
MNTSSDVNLRLDFIRYVQTAKGDLQVVMWSPVVKSVFSEIQEATQQITGHKSSKMVTLIEDS